MGFVAGEKALLGVICNICEVQADHHVSKYRNIFAQLKIVVN